MNDASAVALELRRLSGLVEQLLAEVRRDTLTPAQRSVLAAVARLYGPQEPFGASTLADAARFDPETRTALQRACNGDVQRLGILLGQIAASGARIDGMRLVRLPKEAGARRWVLDGGDPL
jgi:hypothetical protein